MGVNFDCYMYGLSKGFKGCFDNVMGINVVKLVDVEGYLIVVYYGYKKFLN